MSSEQSQNQTSRFLDFQEIPYGTKRDGALVLNRYSAVLTSGRDYPGAKAMLYAAVGRENADKLMTAPQVGMTRLRPAVSLDEQRIATSVASHRSQTDS